MPSLNISKKLENGKTLKLAYNKRIQRPSIQFLNPNIQAANPLNVTIGNPNLNPEYTDNYELSYSTFIKGTSLNFSGFLRNTTGAIQSIREAVPSGDTIKTRFANIGLERAYGVNFFGNVRIGKNFTLNGGTDVLYSILDNNLDGAANIRNSGWVINGRIFGNYNLKNGWGLQFFSHYRGRQVLLQGKRSTAEKIVYDALAEIERKTGSDPIPTLKRAVENVRPALEVRSRRVGGATYQVPVEVRPRRATTLAIRWVVGFSRQRRERTMAERLAAEIMDASNGLGASIKRKDDLQKMAESNKAFAHYRW